MSLSDLPLRGAPIGVFDSGVGGLDVAAELARALPHEALVYIGDTARVPYGTRTAEEVLRFTREAARTLVGMGVKAVVLACNTASAVALEALRGELPVPVLGMVSAGVEAVGEWAAGGGRGAVLVLATPGTVRAEAYQRALAAAHPGRAVHALACPLFVPLVEEGWAARPISALITAEQLRGVEALEAPVGAALLGCTHYPLMRGAIGAGLTSVLGREVPLLDGARAVARQLEALLRARALLAPPGGAPPARALHTTSDPARVAALAAQFWRARVGEPLPPIAPLTLSALAPS
ncbi:MAG: glutamate racemase [Deltaproteobacteria bacterium]|nr:glutamate racemase [Deltaproteobacteria bacterium]